MRAIRYVVERRTIAAYCVLSILNRNKNCFFSQSNENLYLKLFIKLTNKSNFIWYNETLTSFLFITWICFDTIYQLISWREQIWDFYNNQRLIKTCTRYVCLLYVIPVWAHDIFFALSFDQLVRGELDISYQMNLIFLILYVPGIWQISCVFWDEQYLSENVEKACIIHLFTFKIEAVKFIILLYC